MTYSDIGNGIICRNRTHPSMIALHIWLERVTLGVVFRHDLVREGWVFLGTTSCYSEQMGLLVGPLVFVSREG